MQKNFSSYKARRTELINRIKNTHSQAQGVIVLVAGFEHERYRFRQESTFYYFTGLEEPATVLTIDIQTGHTTLYIPKYGESRQKWVSSPVLDASASTLKEWGIDTIQVLGDACKSYSTAPACIPTEYAQFATFLEKIINQKGTIFTYYTDSTYTESFYWWNQLSTYVHDLRKSITDISGIIASMRRNKSKEEVELLFDAVACTMAAQEAVAQVIEPGKYEYEVQAALEFIFTASGGSAAFPSIVSSGAASTVLHYSANKSILKKGDLVIVDIGAELDYYCADLTRTYPVSGTFTKRQMQVYKCVLETQEYLESILKPGYWLSNKQQPEKSLHHLAHKFLEAKGYSKYFTHGIGHFLGLDVHDMGSYADPLKEGDIITLEPGIYIPEEQLGIRIEDNYWLIPNGATCLSQELPKNPHVIEEMMIEQTTEDSDDEDYE